MLTPWKESYDQSRQHIKKQRHYFANKGPSSQSYGFSRNHIWMSELHYIFELWYWRRLLRAHCTVRRWNSSILKEINPEYLLQGLTLKLKFHLMWTTDSLEKILMLGKIEVGGEGDDRGWDSGMESPTRWTWVWASKFELVVNRVAWHAAVHGVAKSWTWLSDWS